MKSFALGVVATVVVVLSGCSDQDGKQTAVDPAASDSSSASPSGDASSALDLPTDPVQSADPGQLLYDANKVVTIDHDGDYVWHSSELPRSAGTPGAILFEYRFNGDLQESDVVAKPEVLDNGNSDIVFTFHVENLHGPAAVQIIKAAAHELEGDAQ
jgi:hypothetical protein